MRIQHAGGTVSLAEQMQMIYRTLAMLSDTILPAVSQNDLYVRVCRFLVDRGAFVTASVLAPDDSSTDCFTICAAERYSGAAISVLGTAPESDAFNYHHLIAYAYINQQPSPSDADRAFSATVINAAAEPSDTSALALPLFKTVLQSPYYFWNQGRR